MPAGEAFKPIDPNTILIRVPRKRVSYSLLIFSSIFFLFFLAGAFALISGHQPPLALLIPSAALIPAGLTFGAWREWFKTGQVIRVDPVRKEVVLYRKLFSFFNTSKRISFDQIQKISVELYVVYRSGKYGSAGEYRGYCLTLFPRRKKLFWFITSSENPVGIGAYLEKEEAEALKKWLTEKIRGRV